MTPRGVGTEPSAAELAAAAACEAVLNAYADWIDDGRASRVVELFTEDAVFEGGPRTLSGRAQLDAAFAAREADATRRTRHLVLNPSYAGAADGVLEVRSTLLLFVLDPTADPALPLEPRALVHCVDRMVRGAEARWRIARRSLQLVAGKL